MTRPFAQFIASTPPLSAADRAWIDRWPEHHRHGAEQTIRATAAIFGQVGQPTELQNASQRGPSNRHGVGRNSAGRPEGGVCQPSSPNRRARAAEGVA